MNYVIDSSGDSQWVNSDHETQSCYCIKQHLPSQILLLEQLNIQLKVVNNRFYVPNGNFPKHTQTFILSCQRSLIIKNHCFLSFLREKWKATCQNAKCLFRYLPDFIYNTCNTYFTLTKIIIMMWSDYDISVI